jgi:hypothetical protein
MISGYAWQGQPLFAAIFEQSTGPPFEARHDMTSDDYQATVNQLTGLGYRPTSVAGYEVGGQPWFAAIFEQVAGPPIEARHHLTSDDFQQACDQLIGQGYRPSVISGYHWNGQPLFAAVFEQTTAPPFEVRHNLTTDDYQQMYNQLVAQGYRLRIVSGYEWSGQPLFVAVFEQIEGPPFEARHNLTSDDFVQFSRQLTGAGYHPVLIDGYDVAGQPLFAAIFER